MQRSATSGSDNPVDHRLCELMVGAQGGNKQHYADLLVECVPIIRRAARRAGAHPEILDDIVQESLITLHGARQTFDPSRSFVAWLSVIAQRRAVDVLRRSGRIRSREIHAPIELEQHADPNADASSAWREAGRAEDLSRAIAKLTPGQREAVENIAVKGRTLAEASVATGRTKGALKVNFHRALEALKQRLATGSGEHD